MNKFYDVDSDDLAYLNLTKDDIKGLKNPFKDLTNKQKDNLHLYALSLMRNPKYFYWTVKTLLNIELLPEQVVVLRELWTRSFPMYIASRGFGKSFLLAVYCSLRCALIPGTKIVIVGAAFRQSKIIFEYMDTIWKNAPLLQSICSDSSGPRRDIDRCLMKINESWTMAVPLGDGSKIRGLRAHTIIADEFNCLDGNTLIETDNGLIRIGSKEDPSNLMINTGDENIPFEKPDTYVITQPVDTYEVKFDNGYIIRCSANHQLMTQHGWKNVLDLNSSDYVENNNTYQFPKNGPINDKKLCWLIGLLISEGSICDKKRLSIKTTDKNLANKLYNEFGFSIHEREAYTDKRGWNCKKSYELYKDNEVLRNKLYKLGLDYVTSHNKKIPDALLKESKECMLAFLEGLFEGDGSCFTFGDRNRLGLAYYSVSEQLCRDLQLVLYKLGFDSYLNKRKSKDQWFIRLNSRDAYDLASLFNIERFQSALNIAYIPDIPSYYTWDNNRSMWKISISYCGKLIQKRFKELSDAKKAIDEILSRPKYRKIKCVTKLDQKMILYDYHLPKTHSFYAGGFRNHNSIPVDIYETVVAGFAAVSAKPTDNVKKAAKRKKMQAEGRWSDQQETAYRDRQQNQSILAGTCGYDFEPFADYWKKYKSTILNKGNFQKLLDDESQSEIPDYMKRLDWKQFSVIRIPYELIPEGFMDDQQVTRARATMHNGIYQMEYGACKDPNTLIQTSEGLKKIIDVKIGDLVLTHKGRFRKVLKKMYRKINEDILSYKTYGYNQYIKTTLNHPFWIKDDEFIPISNGLSETNLVNLSELNQNRYLHVENIVSNALETLCEKYLYPKSSQSIIDINQQHNYKNSTQALLSKKYNLKQTAISYIQNNANIPKKIKLDYNFGLIIGYYAAEGSIGSNGKQVEFALDKHKDTSYQKQLLNAIKNVFNFDGKKYIKSKNTVVISINSRLVSEIINYICPGLSANKLIKHDILFSNKDFLKGVLEGYWNGHGHIRKNRALVHCINQSLLNQIRIALSYFGISASLMDGSQGNDYSLNISGNNYYKFMSIIYCNKLKHSQKNQFIINDDNKTILSIIDKRIEPYNGYVYNLEVEEDNSYSTLNATVHNCFTSDSQGFFRRSLIEAATAHQKNIEKPGWPGYCPNVFDINTRGNPDKQYVFGIDPASEQDNFALIVLELHPEHQRLVYSWTTNKKDFQARVRMGLTDISDYYSFCVRKVRELMRVFPCVRIGIDSQGGGYAIAEGLADEDKLQPGERKILPIIEEGKSKPTDDIAGDHILEFINFASAEWTSKANHGLRKDIEDKVLLFPRFDTLTLTLMTERDKIQFNSLKETYGDSAALRLYDTLEDCVMDIEDLKTELTTVVVSVTSNGRERFDTPEIKLDTGKKGRMRKDRYSALVIANMLARSLQRSTPAPTYVNIGRVIGMTDKQKSELDNRMYNGPEWTQSYNPSTCFMVKKRF